MYTMRQHPLPRGGIDKFSQRISGMGLYGMALYLGLITRIEAVRISRGHQRDTQEDS